MAKGICAGRVAIVTGAGRGLGREHALELARQGAAVVVNDLGTTLAGEGSSAQPADDVVREIREAGGRAVSHAGDITTAEGAASLVQTALDEFGGLDILVNNAGFVRDRMLVNTTDEEWDAVIRVHLRGHFLPMRAASNYWRTQAKAGEARVARIINTSSGAGLQGSVGQSAYSAAKAGIAGLTLVAAAELGRYGVTVNAIAPSARTRMTADTFTDMMAAPESGFDRMSPANVSPIVAWIASEESGAVTGRVIEIEGGRITLEDGWRHAAHRELGRRWEATEAGQAIRELIAETPAPEPVYGS